MPSCRLNIILFITAFILSAISEFDSTLAWVPTTRIPKRGHPLFVAEREERKQYRQENTDKQAKTEKDGFSTDEFLVNLHEAVKDLESLESKAQSEATSTITTTPDTRGMSNVFTKPRGYPFFLSKNVVQLAESTVSEVNKNPVAAGIKAKEQLKQADRTKPKERIVILGTGWGGASFLKAIDTDWYDVTIISPRNHFVFTPMLAGASVGTVEFRSICEPIREICHEANYLEATAISVNPETRTITCQSTVAADGDEVEEFTVQYDKLIVTVGSKSNTFGISGVQEHCHFLRQIDDARDIRTKIIECFEKANLPTLSDEEREHLLTFAIIGAGPSGIEFAGELRDFVEEDGPKYYPDLLKYARIKVIEATSTVLAPFDKSLQQQAIDQMNSETKIRDASVRALLPERFHLVELLLEAAVKEVGEHSITLKNGRQIPYGLAVWAAGNGPLQFTLDLIKELGPDQAALQNATRGRLAIDPWMRVIGSEGNILALGDCTCIVDGQPLPATGQVASQQGTYLARMLNKKFDYSPIRTPEGIFPPPHRNMIETKIALSDSIASHNHEFAKPFHFSNYGVLAYIGGGNALAQITPAPPNGPVLKGTGHVGNAVWKSLYFWMQFSMRNRLLVLNDWTRQRIFGRDITNF